MIKTAIIDLGTNTFHLLIIGISQNNFTEIYRERIQVYLAEDGISKFGEKAFQRALDALDHFKSKVQEYKIDRVKAIATAGFRKAENSQDLQKQIFNRTGFNIEVITGDREAELIFKGVKMAVPLNSQLNYLIMDIGGGSVEFIIVHNGQPVWARSFEIGVAILFHSFNQVDPIPEASIKEMELFLEEKLAALMNELKKYSFEGLLGASGSFEVIEGMIIDKEMHDTYSILKVSDFRSLFEIMIKLDYKQRLGLDNLPANRANLIVSGLLLMRFIINKANISNIYVSQYAIKEGIISEYI
jgi:exopolyphosphatase/guanosine-5'-triphosphate,3'-diphosphate pyrophosphatase